ncbi:MAG: hypothetical protein AAF800_15115, partial [Planctomycetota bacterium]
LFDSFRMALQPTKLLLGLTLLLLFYFGGLALDLIWGESVFRWAFTAELSHFDALIGAATRLDLGLAALSPSAPNVGVVGALRGMVIDTPAALWASHPLFFVVLVSYGLTLATVFGGAIARLAATQACADTTVGLAEAARFVGARLGWLVLNPLAPLVAAGAIWLTLAVAGWALFHLPGLDVLGGLAFGLMLFGGFVAACLLLFVAFGAGLLPAALAVEGTDAFDVISRVFAFLIYRPMRYLLLSAVALVYGALTYLLVGLVVFLTLWFTRSATGVWVGEFDRLLPPPQLGQPLTPVDVDGLGVTQKATSWLIRVWSALLFGVSIAYAASYFFTAQTWVYLLLRRDVDGTAFAEYSPEPASDDTPPASDKVEPAAADDTTEAGGDDASG